ncbi:unnamed protein product, partial [Rotaria sp. Silwood1]
MDTSIVIADSLARNEFTVGSDIDWFLLNDGSADSQHHDFFRRVREEINKRASKPVGPEAIFDIPVFSHILVHAIGGENDTDSNMIHRLVLFLESEVIGSNDVYNHVKRAILKRYLLEDRGL